MSALRHRSDLSGNDRSGSVAASGFVHLVLIVALFYGFTFNDRRPPPEARTDPVVPMLDLTLPAPVAPRPEHGGGPKAAIADPVAVESTSRSRLTPLIPQPTVIAAPAPLAPSEQPLPDSGTASSGAGMGGAGSGVGTGTGNGPGGDGIGGYSVRARRVTGYLAAADYPASALATRARGTTAVALDITGGGRVDGCAVVHSSGNADLDAAVCRVAHERFRYRPARDRAGNPTADRVKEVFAWVLPR